MAMLALLMRPWILRMLTIAVQPRLLADGFHLWAEAHGERSEVEVLADGLAATFRYLADVGAKAQPAKSRVAASTPQARRALAKMRWGCARTAVQVVL
eukprot:2566358-Alexandrium_andersonii.AAC.1